VVGRPSNALFTRQLEDGEQLRATASDVRGASKAQFCLQKWDIRPMLF